MKQSITVILSSVLTIGLLVSPVDAKSVERNDEVLKFQLENVEKSKVLPSQYVFYKYIMNKGESTPFLYKLFLQATKNIESDDLKNQNKLDQTNVKEEIENKEATVTTQNEEKKQEDTSEKVEQKKTDVNQNAAEQKPTAKESVQVPTQEKTTNNAHVNEQTIVKTPETTQQTQPNQSTTVKEQSPTTTVKEQPTQQVSDSIMLQVVNLTNKEREKVGLQPLQVDSALMASAQEKSLDMKNNNYFSHQSPTLGSPFDQMKKNGITYKSAGENIAKGQTTAEQVVQGWMNSSGHRANILDSKYTHIGVGYVAEGNYWTQQFIQK